MSTAAKCGVCQRDPKTRNNDVSECSHIDCPSRRHCWSEGALPHYRKPDSQARDERDRLFDNPER